MNTLRMLLAIAVASPLLASCPVQQDPAAADWSKDITRACTSPRYGLRLAASRKVAAAGADAVPALLAYGKDHTFPSAMLIDAIADADSTAPAMLAMLRDWAIDRDFYWRSSAMRGLARRAAHVTDGKDELGKLFQSYRDDDAWLTRTHARFGLLMLGDDGVFTLPEVDERARVRLVTLALGAGKTAPLQPLFDALVDGRTFLDSPWGPRLADESMRALRSWLGDAAPANVVAAPDIKTAEGEHSLAQLLEAAKKKSGQPLAMPTPRSDPATPAAGGIEVLSCRNGDLFVQWTREGVIAFGLDEAAHVTLPVPVWDELMRQRASLPLTQDLGVVICDTMRIKWNVPPVHVKVAPASLPREVDEWLKRLAQAIEEAGEPRLAGLLRSRLQQFAPR